jgi:bacteriocin-like protein
MPVGRALFLLGGLVALSGCTNDSTTTNSTINTALRVDPTAFLGSLRCLGEPGGVVGAYVAGIHSGRSVALPSSPPVACHVGATFESTRASTTASSSGTSMSPEEISETELANVEGGGHYVAEIVAFDVPPCDGTGPSVDGGPVDCATAGSKGAPVAVDDSGTMIAPRWTARCGLDPEGGVLGAGSLADAGAPQDGGADGPYIGFSYRGDLPPLWTTAQDGRVLSLQGCTVLQ